MSLINYNTNYKVTEQQGENDSSNAEVTSHGGKFKNCGGGGNHAAVAVSYTHLYNTELTTCWQQRRQCKHSNMVALPGKPLTYT